MTFKPWTPDQIAKHDALVQANLEKTLQILAELADKFGYVSVATMEELGLTPEQMKQLTWNQRNPDIQRPHRRFYKAKRQDGEEVKLIAQPMNDGNVIAADIFSPAFYSGHGGNHDFNYTEMEWNMRQAIELPPYKK